MVYGTVTTVAYMVSFLGHTEVLEGVQVFKYSLTVQIKEAVCCVDTHVYVEASGLWRSLLFPVEKACL